MAVSAQVSITRWVEHSDEVLLRAKDAEIDIGKMRAALREYIASSDKAELAEFTKAKSAFENELEELATLVSDNPAQERRAVRIAEASLPVKVEELIKERDTGALRADEIAQFKTYSQQMLDALEAFIAAEYALAASGSCGAAENLRPALRVAL